MKHFGIELSEGSKIENLIVPTYTKTQRDQLATTIGEMIYQTDDITGIYVYTNTGWVLCHPAQYVTSVNNRSGLITLDKTDVGLSNVDNTADLNKPISTSTQTALDLKAPKANPLLTGNVIINDDINYVPTSDKLQVNGSAIFNDTIIQKIAGGYGWRDLQSDLNVRGSGINDPTFETMYGNLKGYAFAANKMNEVYAYYHIDHDYKLGTNLYPHVHWLSPDSNVGDVTWSFEYAVAKGHSVGTFGTTTTVSITQANAGAWKHHIAEVAIGNSIPGTDIEPDTMLILRAYRDPLVATDTYASKVFVIKVDLHYQVDRYSTKNKSPNFYG